MVYTIVTIASCQLGGWLVYPSPLHTWTGDRPIRWKTPASSVTYLSGWWFQLLWKIWKSVGIIVPNIWKNIKCSESPTSSIWHCFTLFSLIISLYQPIIWLTFWWHDHFFVFFFTNSVQSPSSAASAGLHRHDLTGGLAASSKHTTFLSDANEGMDLFMRTTRGYRNHGECYLWGLFMITFSISLELMIETWLIIINHSDFSWGEAYPLVI